jgi:hypothetical protein
MFLRGCQVQVSSAWRESIQRLLMISLPCHLPGSKIKWCVTHYLICNNIQKTIIRPKDKLSRHTHMIYYRRIIFQMRRCMISNGVPLRFMGASKTSLAYVIYSFTFVRVAGSDTVSFWITDDFAKWRSHFCLSDCLRRVRILPCPRTLSQGWGKCSCGDGSCCRPGQTPYIWRPRPTPVCRRNMQRGYSLALIGITFKLRLLLGIFSCFAGFQSRPWWV